jgi:hypothetical protein
MPFYPFKVLRARELPRDLNLSIVFYLRLILEANKELGSTSPEFTQVPIDIEYSSSCSLAAP